jgi:hypothetical protein
MLDRFFESYYRLQPVNATFTGVHQYDDRLPDWSPEGLEAAAGATESLRRSIAPLLPDSAAVPAFPDEVDLVLADAYLEIQLAELANRHFLRGNPALYTGEAVFSVIGLATRGDAPLAERLDAAVGRMLAIPRFLDDARRTLVPDVPAAWTARARRECEGAALFFSHGLPRLLDEEAARLPGRLPARVRSAAEVARAAFARFDAWLAGDLGAAEADRYSAGPEFLDLLVTRGHLSDIGPPELLARAREEFTEARARLHGTARAADPDGWPGVQEQLARCHPTVEAYLNAYHRVWEG